MATNGLTFEQVRASASTETIINQYLEYMQTRSTLRFKNLFTEPYRTYTKIVEIMHLNEIVMDRLTITHTNQDGTHVDKDFLASYPPVFNKMINNRLDMCDKSEPAELLEVVQDDMDKLCRALHMEIEEYESCLGMLDDDCTIEAQSEMIWKKHDMLTELIEDAIKQVKELSRSLTLENVTARVRQLYANTKQSISEFPTEYYCDLL